jgi:hypothetical protein
MSTDVPPVLPALQAHLTALTTDTPPDLDVKLVETLTAQITGPSLPRLSFSANTPQKPTPPRCFKPSSPRSPPRYSTSAPTPPRSQRCCSASYIQSRSTS